MGIWTKKTYKRGPGGDWKCYCGHERFQHMPPSLNYCTVYGCQCYTPRYPYTSRPAKWRQRLGRSKT